MAEHNLPKVATGVRFSSPAPLLCRCSSMVERDLAKVDTAVQFRSSAPWRFKPLVKGFFILCIIHICRHFCPSSIVIDENLTSRLLYLSAPYQSFPGINNSSTDPLFIISPHASFLKLSQFLKTNALFFIRNGNFHFCHMEIFLKLLTFLK